MRFIDPAQLYALITAVIVAAVSSTVKGIVDHIMAEHHKPRKRR